MKLEEYKPFIMALPMTVITHKDEKCFYLSDLLAEPPGPYLLSLCNPKCTLDESVTSDFSYGLFYRGKHFMKYYLDDAIVEVGKVTVKDIAETLISATNRLKRALTTDAPDIAKHLNQDIDFTIRSLLKHNGLNELVTIEEAEAEDTHV